MQSFFKTLLIVVLMACTMSISAQNQIVTGSVYDDDFDEPLLGVTVQVKGTTNGATTDMDGNFSVNAPKGATLVVSYIGYTTQEVVANGAPINVRLKASQEILDDVVVVGYQVQKKRDVLGAISKVDNKELTAVPVPSAQQALQGRIAGVQVSTQTGAPGSDVSVRVRGIGSVSSSNDPLYIVDGVPVEGALNNISPNDIENITVLKDASSAAIYGSRANNGVVLITTRSGKSGDAKVTFNAQFGFQQHGKLIEMCNTDQYVKLYNEAATSDNLTATIKRTLLDGDYLNGLANENHLENIFQTAPLHQYELSVSGGNEKTRYLLSGSYFDQEGILTGTEYRRGTMRANVNTDVKKWLQVGMNIQGGYSYNRMVSSSGDGYAGEGGSVVRYALFRNPGIPTRDADGNYVDLPSAYFGNPLYNSFLGDGYSPEGLCENTDRTRRTKTLLATGNIIIKLPANIIWKSTAGMDYKDATLRVFNPTWGTEGRINATNSLEVIKNDSFTWTVNSTLNHSITLGKKHSLNTLLGVEAIREVAHSFNASESDFTNVDPNFLYLGKGNSQRNVGQGESAYSLLSFFGSVNYNYASKYYLSATIREDGSSRFAEGNRWGTFYSASAGWNMEEEEWMKDIEVLNKLKLRAGFGAIGNQNIGLYAYTDRYSGNRYYNFGGVAAQGYVPTSMANKDLKWETSNQFNAGVDVEFLKGQVGFTIDYYYKVTNDMLVQASYPISIGNASTPWINSGSVLNTGIDFEAFYRKNYRKGGFNITLNGGWLKNEVTKMDAPIEGARVDTGVNATRTVKGQPIGAFYLYEMEGIFQDEVEILTSAYQGSGIKPGDIKYKDVNGDNIIDSKDRSYQGSAIPKFNVGLTLGGDYKGFDCSIFFQGAFGQKIYSQVNHDIEGFYRGFNVTKRYYDEHWTPENHSNTQPRASWSGKANNVKASTRFLEDGSYLRLKNVQIGYTVPNVKKLGLENLRVYLAATNLATITGYSGLDPEMTVSTNSAAEGDRANGIDWGTYPVARSYTLGINLTF